MATVSEPVGTSEDRHVTKIEERDVVWDASLGRWRRVTSVWHYVAERSRQDMVKLVLDLSVVHRHVASDDDARYVVLLDDVAASEVRPLSATERRRATRRGGQDDDDTSGSGSTQTTTAASADEATVPDVVETPTAPATSSPETPVATSRQVDQTAGERARRDALRLSRGELAERSGLTVSALWRVENGRGKAIELMRVRTALDAEEARRATGK